MAPLKVSSPFTIPPQLLVFILSLSLLQIPSVVNGHAIPDSYSLKPDSLFKKTELFPSTISILFSERPDPKASYIHVTNSDGKRIDNHDFKITGENNRIGKVTVDRALIAEDVYSVSWATLSLDDGHVSKGTYVAGVGNSLPTDTLSKNISNSVYTPALAAAKIAIVIGQVYILGFIFCQLFILKDIRRKGVKNTIDFILTRRFTSAVIILSIVITVATTVLPLIQSIAISETESEYIKNLSLLYFETANGYIWIAKILSCVIIVFEAYCYNRMIACDLKENFSRSPIKRTVLLYFLLISITIFIAINSLTSHSSAIPSQLLGILSDFIHNVVVSIWIGGLMYISYVFLPNVITISKNINMKGQQIIAQPISILLLTLSRFSVISAICVGIAGLTGLSLAWFHIHSMNELIISDYGRTLVIKLSLVLPLVILGGYHQFWISRLVKILHSEESNESRQSKVYFAKRFSRLKSTIKIECILAAGVLCTASYLAVTSPPLQNTEVGQRESTAGTSQFTQTEFIRALETQGIPINFVISPFVTGFNNITINFPNNNEIINKISNVLIEFKKRDQSLGPIFAKLIKKNQTAFSTYGGYLGQAGEWDIKVIVQRLNSYDLNYRLTLAMNNTIGALHRQNDTHSMKIEDETNKSSDMNLPVALVSPIVIALSAYFSIRALRHFRVARETLGLGN